MSRDWLLYLDDVIESAEKIQRFLRTATLDTFSADELLFDAVLYNLQVIGEAVKKLPAEAKAISPGVDWSGPGANARRDRASLFRGGSANRLGGRHDACPDAVA